MIGNEFKAIGDAWGSVTVDIYKRRQLMNHLDAEGQALKVGSLASAASVYKHIQDYTNGLYEVSCSLASKINAQTKQPFNIFRSNIAHAINELLHDASYLNERRNIVTSGIVLDKEKGLIASSRSAGFVTQDSEYLQKMFNMGQEFVGEDQTIGVILLELLREGVVFPFYAHTDLSARNDTDATFPSSAIEITPSFEFDYAAMGAPFKMAILGQSWDSMAIPQQTSQKIRNLVSKLMQTAGHKVAEHVYIESRESLAPGN